VELGVGGGVDCAFVRGGDRRGEFDARRSASRPSKTSALTAAYRGSKH
jgi:hypothetical protein